MKQKFFTENNNDSFFVKRNHPKLVKYSEVEKWKNI